MSKPEKVLLEVENLKKYFPIKKGLFRKVVGQVKAVDGVDFFLKEGETLGLVGESGCGKTTAGRALLNLIKPTSGSVKFSKNGKIIDLVKASPGELRELRMEIQMIFQDPYSSLDSRMSVRDIIAEPLIIQNIGTRKQRTEKVREILHKVNLSEDMMNRYPHEFSGGQRQRIGVARALVLNPRLIVCDEPVSALDVSVQAQILNLLSDLQSEMQLTFIFIAHDLSVVEHISDRVMVMYLGKIVEMAASERLYQHPHHPYTEALLSAVPNPNPRSKVRRIPLPGNVPDPSNPPQGCNFHPRCSYATNICKQEQPELQKIDQQIEHFLACNYPDLDLLGYEERRAKTGNQELN